MTITHRTLKGTWAICLDPAGCELLFHFSGQIPESMAAVPLELLLPLLNIVQPPTEDDVALAKFVDQYAPKDTAGALIWMDNGLVHRNYDLPAIIWPDGEQQWWQYGAESRPNGGPTTVGRDGTQEWYEDGELHREDGLPAKVYPDGTREWWRNGWRQQEPVFHWRRPTDN